MVEPNQTAVSQSAASPIPEIWSPAPPAGFEEFFCSSFRELVRAAMYAGATLDEAEDAASKTLMEMLRRWKRCEPSLAYARKAVVHNFIKDKTRGTRRVARRLIEQGHISRQEGAEDHRLIAWEDEEWVTHVLSSLPAAQREVMELIAQGLDRDEIAETLSKTKEAIRRNICDARARLARELNPAGEHRQDPDNQRRRQPSRRTAHASGRRPDDHQ